MKAWYPAGILFSLSLLGSCASIDVPDRIAAATNLAGEHGYTRLDLRTRLFDLVAFVKSVKTDDVLHVYIEGDGFAWVTRHQPSRNPTPINPVALKLAVLDASAAAYIARPCQYVATGARDCATHYWTSARFSDDVVSSIDEAISALKRSSGAHRLVLIGYSGGGAIAALVAARRSDVAYLVTVAGNLDPVTWAHRHALPVLAASLNPKDYVTSLALIPQLHLVGDRDDIMPVDIYRSYRAAFPRDAKLEMKTIAGADHSCCWTSAWPMTLQDLP